MTPRLFVRQAAKADVVAAFQWYESHRGGLGDAFAEEVSRTYAAIENRPAQFPVMLDDIRMALVHRFRDRHASATFRAVNPPAG